MDARVTKLSALFEQTVQFEVPFFQRPYVWNEGEHWKPLWEDIIRAMSMTVDGENPPHFLGAVIFDLENDPPTIGVTRRRIIDGQQRLITLQLLLAAVRDICRECGLDKQYGQLNHLVMNPEYFAEHTDDKPKIRPIRPDNGVFSRIVLRKRPEDQESSIYKCYNFYKNIIAEWYEQNSSDIDQLIHTLQSFLQIVIIDIQNKDDAQVIFETLNNRGQRLARADLIWNFLVRESLKKTNEPNDLNDNEAQFIFQDRYWREDDKKGIPRIDKYMLHFLMMKRLKHIVVRDLYLEFKQWYNDLKESMSFQDIVNEIIYFGETYRNWEQSPANTSEGRLFNVLQLLGSTTVYPLVLWILAKGNDKLPALERKQAIDIIESYLFRRLIGGYSAMGSNKLFIQILTNMDETNIRNSLLDQLHQFETSTTIWPTNSELMHRLSSKPLGGRVRTDRIRYILSRINEYLMKRVGDTEVFIYDGMTLEHLMPRNGSEADWPFTVETIQNREQRDEYIRQIGNLTLLTGKLNSAISNGPWANKRREILKTSALALNRPLSECWDEDTIQHRSRELTEIICQIWPRPELGDLPPSSD